MKPIRVILATIMVTGCAHSAAAPIRPDTQTTFDRLADRMILLELRNNPLLGYSVDVGVVDHRNWPDRSASAIAAQQHDDDELLQSLRAIDTIRLNPSARSIHSGMVERLEAREQERVCRWELWNVNHMFGWHLSLSQVAREQPVGTSEERAIAMARWADLPTWVDQEIANARAGLAQGYSAPRSVTRRVLAQVSALVAEDAPTNPLNNPAVRSSDAPFVRDFGNLIDGPVLAALRRYRDFIEHDYLPRARDALGVSANPNGAACYRDSLRRYTTLSRSPADAFALGQTTVAANTDTVRELGRAMFNEDDIARIIQRVYQAPDNRFASEQEFVSFSRDVVRRSRALSQPLFLALPRQQVEVEPVEPFRRAGASSYYELQPDATRPALYRIYADRWADETRGGAEITALHEGFPGHHLQIALAAQETDAPISRLLFNSAYAEGWARYAETLAEEGRMYETRYALISRRLWPARGMVVDPGLHVFGWSREQALAFIRESGRFQGQDGEALLDRIAITPGQLASYDSGALEIMALRREAETALGDRFNLREFHLRVLEHGAVPISTLRVNLEAWIAAERSVPR